MKSLYYILREIFLAMIGRPDSCFYSWRDIRVQPLHMEHLSLHLSFVAYAEPTTIVQLEKEMPAYLKNLTFYSIVA